MTFIPFKHFLWKIYLASESFSCFTDLPFFFLDSLIFLSCKENVPSSDKVVSAEAYLDVHMLHMQEEKSDRTSVMCAINPVSSWFSGAELLKGKGGSTVVRQQNVIQFQCGSSVRDARRRRRTLTMAKVAFGGGDEMERTAD